MGGVIIENIAFMFDPEKVDFLVGLAAMGVIVGSLAGALGFQKIKAMGGLVFFGVWTLITFGMFAIIFLIFIGVLIELPLFALGLLIFWWIGRRYDLL
jgi:hypothetical protein